MRRIVLVQVASIVLLFWALVSASAATRDDRPPVLCNPGRARLIVSDARARIYGPVEPQRSGAHAPARGEVFGCVHGTRSRTPLGAVGCRVYPGLYCREIDQETLAGTIVAYEASSDSVEGASRFVVVRDLRDGRVLHKVAPGLLHPRGGTSTHEGGYAQGIVVKQDGAVAWIAGGAGEVRAVDKSGNRVIATYPEVFTRPDYQEAEPCCLALTGGSLRWMQGGKSHSATLR